MPNHPQPHNLKHFDTWIAPHINGIVLDLGHGHGELSIRSARLNDVNYVISIDNNIDNTNTFRERLRTEPTTIKKKIIQICGNINNILQHLSYHYNNVIAFDIIEHIYPYQITELFTILANRIPSGSKIFIMTKLSDKHNLYELIPAHFAHHHRDSFDNDHLFEITKR